MEIKRKDIGFRIKELRLNNNLTQTEFAALIGAKQANLSYIENDGYKISLDIILKIISKFDISYEWLLTGKGAMLLENKLESKLESKLENRLESTGETLIPLVTISAVAGFGNADFAIQKSDVKDYYVVPKFKDRRVDFMIEVAGSSMYPKYSPGDVVACTILRESKFIQWNKVHVIGTVEQGILIKRVKKGADENQLLLISDNKDYDPFTIHTNEITGMAIVIGVIRLE